MSTLAGAAGRLVKRLADPADMRGAFDELERLAAEFARRWPAPH